jgi:hypothetical protein
LLSRLLRSIGIVMALAPITTPCALAAEFELGPAYFFDGYPEVLGSWASSPALVVGMTDGKPGVVHPELRVSWRVAPFDEYGLPGPPHIPEVHYSEYYGDASQFYRASLGFRFVGSPAYLAVRTGILVADLGQVEQETWPQSDPSAKSIREAPGTGVTITEGYFAVAVGGVIRGVVARGLAIEAEASTIPNLGGVSLQGGVFVMF